MTLPGLDIPFVLLDDSRQSGSAAQSLLFHSPEKIICARTIEDVLPALGEIDAAVDAGFYVAGWVAYECAQAFEPRLRKAGLKKVGLQKPDEPYVWMLVTKHRVRLKEKEINQWLEHAGENGPDECRDGHIRLQQPRVGKSVYERSVATIKNYIEAGDIYQANYTFPYDCVLEGAALPAYRKLRARQPVDYGAFIETGEQTILSFSPELFVRREGSRVQARPMKGTAARRRDAQDDAAAAMALSADEKSRAENLMIVDLIRNDLSRIAAKSSVTVTDMFTVETYPTVHQMTSGVEAIIDESLKPSELLQALFPCGSVTGAPKIRAMEIIAELEASPRGVYCGAIGHFSSATSGEAINWAFNVPIRTMVIDAIRSADKSGPQDGSRPGRLAVGSGIVADSQIDDEYRECILKADFATHKNANQSPALAAPGSLDDDFHLIETMRVEGGAVFLQSRHTARVMDSARYFSIPVEEKQVLAEIQSALDGITDAAESGARHKMRLTVDRWGKVTAVVSAIGLSLHAPLTVRIAADTIISHDIIRRHKTSMRSLYDRATRKAVELGLADVLFFNEKGELAEGAISTIFLETDEGWFTPPLESGALPGVLRSEMLHSHEAKVKKKILSLDDLKNARSIHIGNALRGLRLVTIATYEPLTV